MRLDRSCRFVMVASALGLAVGAPAFSGLIPLDSTRVASGLTLPLYVTAPPGDFNRLFIVEQRGSEGISNRANVRVLDLTTNPPTLLATPFLRVNGVSTASEQGLLGMAFDPNYMTNGIFFLYYTNPGTRVERWTDSDPNDNVFTGSISLTLAFSQPYSNHNGGWIGFSPVDGYLYVATGDGGSACDPNEYAQNLNVLLGKMLRIDPDGPDNIYGTADDDAFPADANRNYAIPPTNPFAGGGGSPELWLWGLRNPWRCSFDRANGDLYIGDVGQNQREEIDYRGVSSTASRNFGWDCREGTLCFVPTVPVCGGDTNNGCTCPSATLTDPIWEYDHSLSRCSVTGGYVYRGTGILGLHGTYFFADYKCNGTQAPIYSFEFNGMTVSNFQDRTAELDPDDVPAHTINYIASFGEDAAGELYICDHGGEIFKIISVCNLAITSHPVSQTVCAGGTAMFSVAISGQIPPVSYTWLKNGNPFGAPNSSTLTLTNVQVADAGSYTVVVQDQCASRTSNVAVLTVVANLPGDIDADCDVDDADLVLFVNVLVDLDADPNHIARSDVNGDSSADGLDIGAFANAYLQ